MRMTEKHGKTLPSPSCDFFTALKKSLKKSLLKFGETCSASVAYSAISMKLSSFNTKKILVLLLILSAINRHKLPLQKLCQLL